jgi:quinohemoprotein ethanol dehydrogenase
MRTAPSIAIFTFAAFAAAQPVKVTDDMLRNAAKSQADWLTYGRDYAETRFSTLQQIDASNVKRLGLAWSFDTDTTRGLEATPLVVNGVMYATLPWSAVIAVDARTGKFKWKWDPEVSRALGGKACCDVVNRGVAVYDNKVYVGTIDGRLAALNADTGKLAWQVQTTDKNQPYTITGAPRVIKGKVIIGNGGAEMGVRGYVSAYDARTGKLAWRFYVVPGDPSKKFEDKAMERAARTWTGEWWKYGGGGTAWDAFAYDPDADLLYVGTGNGSPWNRNVRSPQGGDNLYLSSIVALRPSNGELAWYYQTTPGDSWDYTAVQHILLADLTIGGRVRKVAMQAPKNGFFYVLDRLTGELLSAEPYAHITWATHVDKATGKPVERPQARYGKEVSMLSPGPNGAHNWQPMSFNPQTGLVYIPAQEGSFPYSNDAEFRFKQGTWNLGVNLLPNIGPSTITPPAVNPPGTSNTAGSLLAWDPVAQKARWSVPYQEGTGGGTLTTAGNLVFQGTAAGKFVAYTADKGEKLWEVNLGNSVMAAPMTYQLDGKQYVSVLVGWGGAGAQMGGNPAGQYKAPGRLWTFVPDGQANIEPVRGRPRPELTSLPVNAPQPVVNRGQALYQTWCFMCHGNGMNAGGTIADLRYAAPATYQDFRGIVIDGKFQSLGMPSFKQWLTGEDADAIRAYVLTQRQELMSKK